MTEREPEIDAATLRAAAAGDVRAATRLVSRYERLVFGAAARVLGSGSADVHDVAQETFLKAFRSIGTFDPSGPARMSTWLTTIAVRVAIDTTRRRRRVVSLDDARAALEERSAAVGPDDALDEARARARLRDAMERLGPEHRAVMMLRVEMELSLEAIATTLGIEVGTVKSRLSRAQSALRAALAGPDAKEARHV